MLNTKVVDINEIPVKVFDLKFAIATSSSADLQVISEQVEQFGKICDRQNNQDIIEGRHNLRIANGYQATEVSCNLKAARCCSR